MVKQNPGVERVDGWRELLGACGFASLHLFPFHLPSILCGSAAVSAQDPRKDGHMRQNFSSVQLLSHVQLFAIPWTAASRLPYPSPTPGAYSNSCPSCWKMPSNHLILCRPLLLLPTVFPRFRVFFSQLVPCIRWPKYWSFSFSGGFKSQ